MSISVSRSVYKTSSRVFRRHHLVFLVLSAFLLLFVLEFIFIHTINRIDETDSKDRATKGFESMQLTISKGRLDAAGIVKIYDWVWMGRRWEEIRKSKTVCLATQASVDRLHWIPELEEHWNGRLSLAVFIVSPNQWIALKRQLDYIRWCRKDFGTEIAIHVAIPVGQIPAFEEDEKNVLIDSDNLESHLDCSYLKRVLKSISKEMKTPLDSQLLVDYPQNHLRNIATRGCGSEWVFSTDIDIIPFPNSSSLLDTFVRSPASAECHACAFVIPTFELTESQPYPKSKNELVAHWRHGDARPFHFDYHKPAHFSTNYNKWRHSKTDSDTVNISHNAMSGKFNFSRYEPFYISRASIPPFPERFLGYGYTRVSQAQAALAEGWTFKVLTPIFGIHWGLQTKDSLIDPGKRRAQTMMNKKLFSLFMEEMKLRSQLRHKERWIAGKGK